MRNGGEMKGNMVIKWNKRPNNTKNNYNLAFIMYGIGLNDKVLGMSLE